VPVQHDKVDLWAIKSLGEDRVIADDGNRSGLERLDDIGAGLAFHLTIHNGAFNAASI